MKYFTTRFERLRSWGEPEAVYASRRMYHGVIAIVVVWPDIYLRV